MLTLEPRPVESTEASPGLRSHCIRFAVDLLSETPVRDARKAVTDWLAGWPCTELERYCAGVVVSELVTNEVRASSSLPPTRLVPDPSPVVTCCIVPNTFGADGELDPRWRITLTVSGFGAGAPELVTLSIDEDEDERGRGLIVAAGLCDELRTVRSAHTAEGLISPYGKRVIARLAAEQ